MLKMVPLEAKVNQLFMCFIRKASVTLGKRTAIFTFTNKVIALQRKLRKRIEIKRAQKNLVDMCLLSFIDQ
jgi:hypothetical protein